eukprot:9468867-Pyramimonas_sp.AAC.1
MGGSDPPWKELADRSHITTARIDQCATGLMDTAGDYIKKPTDITSNDEAILKPFGLLKCNGTCMRSRATRSFH